MGFIERIAEVMKPVPTQAEPENSAKNESTEAITQPDQAASTDAGADKTASSEPKTYSEEEIEALIEERKKTWNIEHMNTLSKDSQIEELKAELLKRDLKDKVFSRIEEARLPIGIADFVQYTDETGTMKSVEHVITRINELVQQGITERLRGKTPAGLGRAAQAENSIGDPFAKAFADAMKK